MTISELSKKYGIPYYNVWVVLRDIQPDYTVKRGKKRYFYYDEERAVAALQQHGYLDSAEEALLKERGVVRGRIMEFVKEITEQTKGGQQ